MVDHLLTYSMPKPIRLFDDEILVGEVLGPVELRLIELEEQLYADAAEDVKRKYLLERSPSFLSDPKGNCGKYIEDKGEEFIINSESNIDKVGYLPQEEI